MNAQIAIAVVAESDAKQDIYCRESETCFACGRRKVVGPTLCFSCYVDYQRSTGIGLRAFLELAWQRTAARN